MQHFFTENQWTDTWNICWTIKAARNRWTQIHKYVTILCFQVTDKYIALKFMRFLHKNRLFGPYYTTYRLLTGMLPHSCTASSQALSVNAFPWRIQRTRDVPPTSFPGSLSCFEKEPDCSWSRGSQNLGAKNKRGGGGEVEEIMVAMTKVTPSGPERSLPPLY